MLKKIVCSFCCLVFCLRNFVVCNLSPVLVWGSSNSTNYLSANTTSVSEVLLQALQQHMLVIFLEDNLKAQDIQALMPETGGYCYKYLLQAKPTVYYESAEKVLDVLSNYSTYNELNSAGGLKIPILCVKRQAHVLNFQQHDNKRLKRLEKLHKHDLLMSLLGRRFRHCAKLFVYMSSPSLKRQKKEAEETPTTDETSASSTSEPAANNNENPMDTSANAANNSALDAANNDTDASGDDYILYYDDAFALSYRELKHVTILLELDDTGNEKKEESILQVNSMVSSATTPGSLNVSLDLDNAETITFDLFKRAGNSHLLSKMVYKSNDYKHSVLESEMNVPQYRSYAINKVVFTYRWNDNAHERSSGHFNKEYLIWKDLQFQYTESHNTSTTEDETELEPEEEEIGSEGHGTFEESDESANKTKALAKDEETNFQFYKAWRGESYITPGMLMCLIMSAMMIGIGTVGFIALWNIQNVDHYEDPLAPPFTIDPSTVH